MDIISIHIACDNCVNTASAIISKLLKKMTDHIDLKDIALVGGKNASLDEMIKHLSSLQVNVPQGSAFTSEALRH